MTAAWGRIGLAALLAAGGTGCRRPPALRPLPAGACIVAFGDSLTAGDGAEPGLSYPAQLQELVGRPVINAGVSGERAAAGLARLPSVLREHRPSLVILCHGGNDLLRKGDPDALARTLAAMVRMLRAEGSDVLLLGVPAPGLRLRAHRLYARLARESRVPYDGAILPDILSRGAWKSDPVHPNAKGYRRLAEAVAARLQPAP